MKIHNVLFFLFLFIPSLCFSQEKVIKVSLVNATGQGGLTNERILELFSQAKIIFSEDLGINLQLIKFRARRNPYKQLLDFGNRKAVLRGWEGYFKRRKENRKKSIHFVIMDPIKDQNNYFVAGLANTVCAYRRIVPVAISNGTEYNLIGAPRYLPSVYAFIHEISHLLGADHDDSLPVTIMNSNVLAYVNDLPNLHFSYRSLTEINYCIQ